METLTVGRVVARGAFVVVVVAGRRAVLCKTCWAMAPFAGGIVDVRVMPHAPVCAMAFADVGKPVMILDVGAADTN